MRIPELREKCKRALARIPRDVLLAGVVLGASSVSFGLGVWTGQGSEARITGTSLSPAQAAEEAAPASAAVETPEGVVASKNGTKYYLPTCSGASRIAEKNKVWFATAAAARAQGYAPAAACKGLE